jgi:hypothetical protein
MMEEPFFVEVNQPVFSESAVIAPERKKRPRAEQDRPKIDRSAKWVHLVSNLQSRRHRYATMPQPDAINGIQTDDASY